MISSSRSSATGSRSQPPWVTGRAGSPSAVSSCSLRSELGGGADTGREQRDSEDHDPRDLEGHARTQLLERGARPDRAEDPRDSSESLLDSHNLAELRPFAALSEERARRGKEERGSNRHEKHHGDEGRELLRKRERGEAEREQESTGPHEPDFPEAAHQGSEDSGAHEDGDRTQYREDVADVRLVQAKPLPQEKREDRGHRAERGHRHRVNPDELRRFFSRVPQRIPHHRGNGGPFARRR